MEGLIPSWLGRQTEGDWCREPCSLAMWISPKSSSTSSQWGGCLPLESDPVIDKSKVEVALSFMPQKPHFVISAKWFSTITDDLIWKQLTWWQYGLWIEPSEAICQRVPSYSPRTSSFIPRIVLGSTCSQVVMMRWLLANIASETRRSPSEHTAWARCSREASQPEPIRLQSLSDLLVSQFLIWFPSMPYP